MVIGSPQDPSLPVRFVEKPTEPEGYRLYIRRGGIRIEADSSLGVLHAMRTTVDLWDRGHADTLPMVDVDDHPDFAKRGVFVESFAGSDRMNLADWRTFLDRMGQLKLNVIGVSVYGCWDIHHDGDRSEYLFTPLNDYPQLKSPRRVVTWDPETEGETELRYLPVMFEQDLFGAVARLAANRGIELIPHLGGPGHSTLIPRLVPEMSAVDDDGVPTGYGYCVSQPAARAALARLITCLVRQHLVPNGIQRLHVAADEYYPIRNVDPNDRKRIVSPYCRCADCRELTPGRMLMEYLLQVGETLGRHQITMIHWHDTLVREGVLETYLERVDSLGLPRPVIAWWKYNDPIPVPDAGQTETWCCPTTGFAPSLFNQDFSPNIESVLRRGRAAGTMGAFAYAQPDPCYHMNYAFLADLAWNLENSGGVPGFQQRWARQLCQGDGAHAVQYALSSAYIITGSYPLMMYVIQHILPFFSTAAAGVTKFPDDIVRAFAVAQPALADVLRQVVDTIRQAVAAMPDGRDIRHWPNPLDSWRKENTRLADSLELFLNVLSAARTVGPVSEAHAAALRSQSRALLRSVAQSKPAYAAPFVLREHWGFVREIFPALARLDEEKGVARAEEWYAWIV